MSESNFTPELVTPCGMNVESANVTCACNHECVFMFAVFSHIKNECFKLITSVY